MTIWFSPSALSHSASSTKVLMTSLTASDLDLNPLAFETSSNLLSSSSGTDMLTIVIADPSRGGATGVFPVIKNWASS